MTYAAEVLADTPLVYYRFGDPAGSSSVADSSGNGYTGNFGINLPTFGVAGLLTADADTAIDFPGNAYIDCGAASWQNVSALTVEAWIKTTGTLTQPLWQRDDGPTYPAQRVFRFHLNGGRLEFVRLNDSTNATNTVTATSSLVINDGAVHHVAATYDGSTIVLYVDGVADTTVATAGGIVTSTSVPLQFAYDANDDVQLTGTADEAAFYGTVLSASRISTHYDVGTAKTPPSATDTTNRLNGRVRDGYGIATYQPPVAATPSTLVLGTRVDKAIPLPAPDLVNGRPT